MTTNKEHRPGQQAQQPKSTLITGASSGIGGAIALKMLNYGVDVTGIGRDFSNCQYASFADQFTKVELDLSDLDSLPTCLSQDARFNQSFDCLILNAGYGQFGGIEQFSYQQIRRLIDTNLVSNLFLLKYFLPAFKQNKGGDIVLIGSESAYSGAKQGAVYCASKFAIRGLAQSLRADCAKSGIRVLLVNPGPTDTDFFDDLHFTPENGADYSINPDSVAQSIWDALQLPPTTVIEELNIQPIKRAFRKK